MLLNFFGQECPHCEKMESVIVKLEKDDGVVVERLEVWHNEENMQKLNELDKNFCGGVPFFYNTDTQKWICGEATYSELKAWAGK